jgi:hypothetical protein
MPRKKLYPTRIVLLRHTERDGEEWFEAKESIGDLELPEGAKIDIAEYEIAAVRQAGFMLEISK